PRRRRPACDDDRCARRPAPPARRRRRGTQGGGDRGGDAGMSMRSGRGATAGPLAASAVPRSDARVPRPLEGAPPPRGAGETYVRLLHYLRPYVWPWFVGAVVAMLLFSAS